jgi:integral membrane protein (TIGR00529 family)
MELALNIALGIVALAFTAFCLKKDVNLGIVMLVDSAFVVLIARIPAADALRFAANGIASESTVTLVVILVLIMMLENIMRTTGMIRRIVESLKELAGGNRLAAALLPMVIGLLPSPGGARFSCPMVEEVAQDGTDAMNKSFINFWFRHIWMDGFILYPGIILASGLLGVSVISMFVHLLPFMAASALIGYIAGLSRLKREKIARTKPVRESLRALLLSFLPVLTIIVLYVALINVVPYSMGIVLAAVVLALLIIKKYDLKMIVKLVRESFPWRMIFIIVGAMVFMGILGDGGVLNGLPGVLRAWGLPVALLFIALPFIGAAASGITVNYVSLAFPILIPLGLGGNLWLAAATFAVGFLGNMVTPLHLCAVMTADFFHTPLRKLLQRTALAISPLFVVAAVMILLLRTG